MKVLATVEAFALQLKTYVEMGDEYSVTFPTRPADFEPGPSSATSSIPSRSSKSRGSKSNQNKSNTFKPEQKSTNNTGANDERVELPSDMLTGFRGSLSDVYESDEEDTYCATWHNGDKKSLVFIVKKTTSDAREIDFLKEFDHRGIVELIYHEISGARDGKTRSLCSRFN
jgi:hypothetical protein